MRIAVLATGLILVATTPGLAQRFNQPDSIFARYADLLLNPTTSDSVWTIGNLDVARGSVDRARTRDGREPLTLQNRRPVPIADHHQHVFSRTIVALLAPDSAEPKPLTARDVVALLDSGGIQKALLLSTAYIYGSPSRTVEDEYAKVRAENDWTATQAAEYPGRLRAFCGFNPLRDYALEELARCARHPGLRRGIKLHLGNSDVQLENEAHVAQLRRVFRAANQHRMGIVVHMRASISKKRPYGARQARIFLEQLLPAAPDIPIQIAHLAGTGPGYDDPPADSAMAVLAAAVEKHDPRTRRLWFDVTTVVDTAIAPATAALVVRRIRQVGVNRILYGSDAAAGGNLRPREGWAAFLRLPLTQQEFATIARNVAPYLR